MLTSLHSPQDNHLRNLLDQRATRAHLHSRFPSVSDISDSPSVYSRAFFSPRPMDRSDSRKSDHAPPLSPADRTHQERYNDPTASMLDLDDDPRSSFDSSEAYEENLAHFDDDDDEPMPRMSILGPKMRYHSRAPWEMDEGSLFEEDEIEPRLSNVTSPNYTGGNVIKRGIGFSSSSPGSSNAERPSGESSRSQSRSKTSSDTAASYSSNSRGPLHILAQDSPLSTAPSPAPNPAYKSSRSKFSLGLRTRSPKRSVPPSPDPPAHGHLPPVITHFSDLQSSLRCSTNEQIRQRQAETQSSKSPRPSDSYVDEDVHPYANPDLVVFYAQELPPPSPLRVFDDFSHLSRSDSAITVTDSIVTSTISKTGSVLTTDTSAASMPRDVKGRVPAVNGREISSPLSVYNSTLPSETPTARRESGPNDTAPMGVSNLHGWMDRGMRANVALISLEEARAQRSRSITTPSAPPRHSENSTMSLHMPPFDSRQDSASITNSFDDSPISSVSSVRARARSISAGARAKNALQTIVGSATPQSRFERRDSESAIVPLGKSLKHKKSGFMRLFNSARDKEERDPPPPVPSLSGAYAAHNVQQDTTKISSHRIPAPRLSPQLLGHPDKESNTPTLRSSPSPKRTPPPLFITTQHQGRIPIPPISATDDSALQPQTAPPDPAERVWNHLDSFAQSAPPNVTEFPALKLRPISTMFSAQFGEHIVQRGPPLTSDSDPQSPSSARDLISPITPFSYQNARADQFKDKQPMISTPEDQSSIIRALQDQVATAKTAWQQQIWELEAQVRDLKAEVEDLRTTRNEKDFCDVCGHGGRDLVNKIDAAKSGSILSRPRARTGTSSRFGSAMS